MSSFPGQDPLNPEPFTARLEPSPTAEEFLPPAQDQIPNTLQNIVHPVDSIPADSRLFQSWYPPAPPPSTRIPHLGHLLTLAILTFFGLMCSSLLTEAALHFHLYGISTAEKASREIHYTLGNMVVLYLIPFAASLLIFPLMWNKSFFAGLQWNAKTALHLRKRLFGAASACFVLAMADGMLMPGPPDAPIDKLFQTPTQAWLLFAFGVTFAPFFEEIFFRGFLLPSLCTAWDWIAEYAASENEWPRATLVTGSAVASIALAVFCEKAYGHHRLLELFLLVCFITFVFCMTLFWVDQRYKILCAGLRARPLGENGHPQWSMPAMVGASIITSIPFAWMHAEQIANSMGPLLLLYCVSLILCWVRLTTRSLAASVLVHTCYNFLLFSLMLLGTGGFRHFDKM